MVAATHGPDPSWPGSATSPLPACHGLHVSGPASGGGEDGFLDYSLMRGIIKEILTLLKVIRRRLIGMGLGAACWGGGGGTWWLPRAPKCCELQLPLLVLASHLGLALFFASFFFFPLYYIFEDCFHVSLQPFLLQSWHGSCLPYFCSSPVLF